MTSLQTLIDSLPSIFADAVRESESTLANLEATLNISLPQEIRWFWLSCGSGNSGAAPNANTSIKDTLRYRSAILLPTNYLVLEDRNDAGTVLLDTATPSGRVLWVDSHALVKLSLGTIHNTECDSFEKFTDWVSFCIDELHDNVP